MLRKEMIEFIRQEVMDAVKNREYSNESDDKYYFRKAEGILTMLEGFGMPPPAVAVHTIGVKDVTIWEENLGEAVKNAGCGSCGDCSCGGTIEKE